MNYKLVEIEKQFDYKGHDCICTFIHLGFRCGYVSVPTNRTYFEYNISCHGSLTHVGKLPYGYGRKQTYYIGFDCGHSAGDGVDYNKAFEYGLIDSREPEYYSSEDLCNSYPAKTLDFVIEQCKHIVDQLEDKENKYEKI